MTDSKRVTQEDEGWAEMSDRDMLSYAWSVLSKAERVLPHSEVEWAEVATAVRHLRQRLDALPTPPASDLGRAFGAAEAYINTVATPPASEAVDAARERLLEWGVDDSRPDIDAFEAAIRADQAAYDKSLGYQAWAPDRAESSPASGDVDANAAALDVETLARADIPVIRARLIAGESAKTIAVDYGVSERAIHKIKVGEGWAPS